MPIDPNFGRNQVEVGRVSEQCLLEQMGSLKQQDLLNITTLTSAESPQPFNKRIFPTRDDGRHQGVESFAGQKLS